MTTDSWVLLVVVVALLAWYLSIQAGRLDRLHHKIDLLEARLDGHLTRRAAVLGELSGFLDPVSSVVAANVTRGPDL